MLPALHHPVWKEIVIGKKTIQTEKATINLLTQSSRMSYGQNPCPDNLNGIVAKMYGFFARYESTFASEIAQITE
ncbi:MAG TPA: hypothetical protein VGF01_11020 [Terracidiphilus sp.]|jgi:hypothetical protein